MMAETTPEAPLQEVDVLVAGLGPGGCVAALAAHAEGFSTLAVEARGPEGTRPQLVLVRPGARAALQRLRLNDITEGRRTTTLRHVENRLRRTVENAANATFPRAASTADAPLELHWHTSVVRLEPGVDGVLATLRDELAGTERTVKARHLVDAAGGRLESLGRPARAPAGPRHVVVIAEYPTPPWFGSLVGVRDPETHELYSLFPTWKRQSVIAYLDTPPRQPVDEATLIRRFESIAARLELGPPLQPLQAIDVAQQLLPRSADDRVIAIGDAVGTVDVLLGAGGSAAIEDGIDAVRGIAAARRDRSPGGGQSHLRATNERILARHRSWARRGRLMLALRPLFERVWPRAPLSSVERGTVGPPPLLWAAVRFVCGRRPQPS
jgi:flavin-dependent dehydrogenase